MKPDALTQVRSNPECLTWCWEYHAFLTLSTPLAVLARMGNRVLDCQPGGPSPAIPENELDYAAWEVVEVQRAEDSANQVIEWDLAHITMDIPESACHPARYLEFLKKFRFMVEGAGSPSEKRNALSLWLEREVWTDILVCWGGIDSFLNRTFPPFLLYIEDRGTSKAVVHALREIGVTSRADLAALTDEQMLAVRGVGPATLSKLRSYAVADNQVELRDPHLQMIR